MDKKRTSEETVGCVDLKISNISKKFDDVEAVKGVSLTVNKGEICCLLGPSGCGKTTILKMIAGFLQPDTGSILLNGTDITDIPPQKRNVGMVFQTYALFPHMDVYDNVAYGLRRRRMKEAEIRDKVSKILDLVQLAGYESRRIHELSGGQQQRIALARALVIEPGMLLLDEPLSNLDARLRADMREEIRRIQRELKITTVHVTHDQEEAMSITDSIVVMNKGLIEQVGKPRDIYESPATKFVSDFIGKVNFIPASVEENAVTILGKRYDNFLKVKNSPDIPTFAVRPERIKLVENGAEGKRFRIGEMTYFGSLVRYGVEIDGEKGEKVLVNVETPGPDAIFSVGDHVGMKIEQDDILILER